MITIRKIFIALVLVVGIAYSCKLLSQDTAEENNNNATEENSTSAQPTAEAKKATTAGTKKIKKKKRIKVKYRDLNVVIGVRKELYLNFPLGTVRQPTKKDIFNIEINRKADNPNLEKDRIVFTGLQPGITDLWVYDNNDVLRYVYNVTVTEKNLKRLLGFLRKEFKHIEGLKMYIREKRIILDGEILLPEDIARIHQVIAHADYLPTDLYKVQYKLSPTLFKIVAQKMQEEIGMPTVQVEVVNQRFVLKGEVKSEEEYKDVILKATLYLPKYFYTPFIGDPSGAGDMNMPAEGFRDKPIIEYFLKIIEPDKPINKVIKVSVYFVEITKGFENAFGFKWEPSIDTTKTSATLGWTNAPTNDNSGNALPPFTTTITGVISNFIPKLQDAVTNNRGRIIQTAAITIEDNEKGSISKTTKYPYLVKTENSVNTEKAEVGIGIKLTPKILNDPQKSKDLKLTIEISVSQVVGKVEGTSYPITASDDVNTTINIKSDDTAAIGGIVQNNLYKAYGDGSTDDNVIVSLSRSKSFTKNKSQFVVFITPTIMNTANEGSDSVKEKFRVK